MHKNIMKKELKSCTGVLLKADLTGHGHTTCFGRKGLDGHALLGQPSKGYPGRIFFPIMFYYIINTTYQNIGDLFCPVHISGPSHSVKARKLNINVSLVMEFLKIQDFGPKIQKNLCA